MPLGAEYFPFLPGTSFKWFTLCYFKSDAVSTLTSKWTQLILHSHLGDFWTMLPLASSCCGQNKVSVSHFYHLNLSRLTQLFFFNMNSLKSNSKQIDWNSFVKYKAGLHKSNQLCTSVTAHSHWVIPRLSHQHPQSHSTTYISASKTHAAV